MGCCRAFILEQNGACSRKEQPVFEGKVDI